MMMMMNDDDDDAGDNNNKDLCLSSKQEITMSHVRRSYMTTTVRGIITSYVRSLKLKSLLLLSPSSSSSSFIIIIIYHHYWYFQFSLSFSGCSSLYWRHEDIFTFIRADLVLSAINALPWQQWTTETIWSWKVNRRKSGRNFGKVFVWFTRS